MGKNNKARRAAKAKQRAQRPTSGVGGQSGSAGVGSADPFGFATASPFGTPGSGPTRSEQAADLWKDAIWWAENEPAQVSRLTSRLAALPEQIVDAHAQRLLTADFEMLWRHGWQPAELRREVRRRTTVTAAKLIELAILVDHEGRAGQGLDPRWAAQLEEFSQRTVSTRSGWLANWRAAAGLDRAAVYDLVLKIVTVLGSMPALDVLLPPPGQLASVVTLGAPVRAGSHPKLDTVRKLLAKAESSDFEEEAAAFTAKAQALMTQHAIDEALLHAPTPEDVPRMMRVPVDAPYADAKSVLLATVAKANRCQAIYYPSLELSSVVGHDDDLLVVELLFTSLLVQAQKALAEAGRASVGSRTRSQSFRASFFLAYGTRIGERLTGANEKVLAEEQGRSALPVLRAKEAAVEDFMSEHYAGKLTSGTIRGAYDYAGQAAGRAAADKAKLDAGALTQR